MSDIVRTHMTATQIEYGRFDQLERQFGLRRSKCYELINAGKIKSVCIRRKGSRSGVRLIDFASVREFLASQSANVPDELSEKMRSAAMNSAAKRREKAAALSN